MTLPLGKVQEGEESAIKKSTSYASTFPNLSLPSWNVVGLRLGEVLELQCRCQVAESLSTPLSVLCHFVALADCIRSGYAGGQ